MTNSRKILITVVIAAIIITFVAAIFLIIQLVRLMEQDMEQEVDMNFSLYYYCSEHSSPDAENEVDPCLDWADEFRSEHKAILSKCDELAGLNLDELTAFGICMDEAGAQQYLPLQ